MTQQWLTVVGLILDIVGFLIVSSEWLRQFQLQNMTRSISSLQRMKDHFDAKISSPTFKQPDLQWLETVYYDQVVAVRKTVSQIEGAGRVVDALQSFEKVLLMNPVPEASMLQGLKEVSLEAGRFISEVDARFENVRRKLFILGVTFIIVGFAAQLLGSLPGCCSKLGIVPQSN